MTSKSRVKGFTFERKIVNLLKAEGIMAKRGYASQGSSLGLSDDVDIAVYTSNKQYKIQAKRPKQIFLKSYQEEIYNYLEENDCIVFQEDRKSVMVLMKFDEFLEFWRK